MHVHGLHAGLAVQQQGPACHCSQTVAAQGPRAQVGQGRDGWPGGPEPRPLTFADLQATQDQLRAGLDAISDLKAQLDKADAKLNK